jgi:aspartyl-tRNA(Asn)/glutamyl-tRNA(Gln) amidotransferase subunit A
VSELTTLTIHELAPRLERGLVSPVELTRECLERIDQLEPRLHAFVRTWPEEALAAARIAEEEIRTGRYRGPLHGIPMSIKDNIAVAGHPTTIGTALLATNVTDYDATAVARLRSAGAIILGKNNLHEWAFGVSCTGGPFGTIHNPWDEGRVPGGTSGGSAAAVSASLVFGSLGTDAKGSIRIPAAYCGVVGLKPTHGLVSRFGELPPSSMTFDSIGPIAKDVTDAAILLEVIAGHDPLDPMSLASPARDFRAGLEHGVRGLRVGVPLEYFFETAEPEITGLVHAAIDVLRDAGAETRVVRIPSMRFMHIADAGFASERIGPLQRALKLGPSAFADETIWERQMIASLTRANDVLKGIRLHNLIRREFAEVMGDVDILVMPAAPSAAFPIARPEVLPSQSVLPQSPATVQAMPFNIVGLPAISLPCGFTTEALPIGLMITGRHLEDDVILSAARAYERAAGGYRLPPIAREGIAAA